MKITSCISFRQQSGQAVGYASHSWDTVALNCNKNCRKKPFPPLYCCTAWCKLFVETIFTYENQVRPSVSPPCGEVEGNVTQSSGSWYIKSNGKSGIGVTSDPSSHRVVQYPEDASSHPTNRCPRSLLPVACGLSVRNSRTKVRFRRRRARFAAGAGVNLCR